MHSHPYLRAYMAGIVVPTALLLVALTLFTVARCVYHVSFPVERIIVFPMAVVPNAWGAWNALYVSLGSRRRLSLAFHGALLPLLLAPLGFGLAQILEAGLVTPRLVATFLPVALVVYYLAWKYLVGFCNELLGIAE